MFELYTLGISDETLKTMIEITPAINDLSEKEINEKIIILKNILCSDNQIVNIISSNPNYLIRTNTEITELIKTLLEYKFDTLNILFDSNPYILNLQPYEIKKYIDEKISNSNQLDDIIDELDSNPYLFNEM